MLALRAKFVFVIFRIIFSAFFLVGMALSTNAQNSRNLRSKVIQITQEETVLDTLSISPTSFYCFQNGRNVPDSLYFLEWEEANFIWKGKIPTDSIRVVYRVFPKNYSEDIFLKDTTIISSGDGSNFNPFTIKNENKIDNNNLYQLDKSGSITRGITFGNNQNFGINSSLDLQLNGKLTDKINVLASISDANIPIQPEGNTQQLQDFDNIFIQLYDDRSKLIAGDYSLTTSPGYFLKYNKRAQGITFQNRSSNENSKQYLAQASLAISKGKFARHSIQGVEGNQGPYRLQGAENENFIIVLSGTERVYIDGKLLERGLNLDYVINYNSAEVTFTARQPITKDKRIIVEYQYSDKHYARSLIEGIYEEKTERLDWFVNVYAEQDSKSQPLQEDLDSDDKEVLFNAGDNLFDAAINGVDSVSYSNELVLYQEIDSLGFSPVYLYSTDPELADFQIIFSEVGPGNGDYIESDFTANGKVYQWVKPDLINGELIHNGDYAPIRLLTPPNKQQMISLGGEFKISKLISFFGEGSVSNQDLNTFSSKGNSDNVGGAWKGALQFEKDLNKMKDTLDNWNLTARLYTESNTSNFRRIERFRSVEFNRDWNLTSTEGSKFDLYGFNTKLEKQNLGFLSLGLESLSVDSIQGLRGNFSTNFKKGRLSFEEQSSLLDSKGALSTFFLRHKSLLVYDFKAFRLGFKDEFEQNERSFNDSIQSSSYWFYDGEIFASNADTTKLKYKLFYRERRDRGASDLELINSARSEQYGVNLGLTHNPRNQLTWSLSNRKLIILNDELVNSTPENTLLTQLNHSFKNKSAWLQLQTFYEIGSGLEQQREFIYLEVPAGQGIYVWNDYNEDNVKDLNEFEIAQFEYEANYIRTFIPSEEYSRVYTNVLNENIQISPSRMKLKETKVNNFIKKFASSTTFRTERKTKFEEDADRFNPFITEVSDTTLLSFNGLLRNTLFFQRTNPKFGVEFSVQSNSTKTLLTNGFESRENEFLELVIRWSFIDNFNFQNTARMATKLNSSDFLEGRNFLINSLEIEPILTWSPEPKFSMKAKARFIEKENAEEFNGERSQISDLGVEGRFNSPGKGSFIGTINWINNQYSGAQNSSLAFEMLEGLNPGTNFTWSATWQRKVSNNIQINLNYLGRKSEGNSAIHSGGMSARAFF